jgi:predicted transcriptional regulator
MMNCEVSSRRILPAIRKEIVLALVNKGKKQKTVARMLMVTPAAVTQYIKGKRAKIELTSGEKEEISEIAEKCLKNGCLEEKDLCGLCGRIQSRLKG